MVDFYVVNLARREDRRLSFMKKWEATMTQEIPIFVNAVDGTMDMGNEKFYGYVCHKNNDIANPKIVATILSHLNVLYQISQSKSNFGIVLEDDIHFRDDFGEKIKNIVPILDKLSKKDKYDIVYIGCGDVLPEHVCISETLLRSQTTGHVTNTKYGVLGNPKFGSPFVFDWLGTFGYCVSKQGAKRFLHKAFSKGVGKGFDLWLKENVEPKRRYLTIPLLIYHPSMMDLENYDSDILGVYTNDILIENRKYYISFLIPNFDNVDVLYLTIKNILDTCSNTNMVNFVIYTQNTDKQDYQPIRELCQSYNSYMCRMSGTYGSNMLHEIYNILWRCYFKLCNFFIIWDTKTKILDRNWDLHILCIHKKLGEPNVFCFNLKNKQGMDKFILSRDLIESMDCVSKTIDVNRYIHTLCSLSNILVEIPNINFETLGENFVCENEPLVCGLYIQELINRIENLVGYRKIGN